MKDVQSTVDRDEWEMELEWEVGRSLGGPVCLRKVWEHGPSKAQRQGTVCLRRWLVAL